MRTVLCHESIIGQFVLQQQSTKLFYENEVFSNAKYKICDCWMWRRSALHVRTHNLNRRPNIEQIGEQISQKGEKNGCHAYNVINEQMHWRCQLFVTVNWVFVRI